MLTERDELTVVDGEPVWWDTEALKELDRYERNTRINKRVRKYLPTFVVAAAIVIYTMSVWSLASWRSKVQTEERMAAVYAQELQNYKDEQQRLAEEAIATDPYLNQLEREAEEMARVLYGVRDNDDDDLRTYCWCVFNRVDNNSYPSTIEDVIAQPNQWMRYDPTNPILEDLYQIAYEQLDAWHSNSHRPCSNEFVFMNWSPTDICLRDNFHEGSGTHYWRWK